MRLGYLTYNLDRKPTGIGRYSVELLHALAELPDAPEIVLLSTERADPNGLWKQFRRYPLVGCRLAPGLMSLGNATLSLAARRERLDLIHDPNGIAPFLGPAWGARRVVTIHDAFAYVQPETQNHLDNWRYRWLLPPSARAADAVITVSECSRRDLSKALRLADERVHVIGEGVDAQFRPIPDGAERRAILQRAGIQKPYMLYVGGINARKNIAGLFAAFARVHAKNPDIQLVIVGARQWRTAGIDAALATHRLEEAVHFTGYLANDDLPALYSAAELFVFPSLYEGFGLPPLEAMACGTPVVTSNISSLPEVVGDAAVTVEPTDVIALAAAMELVLRDSGLRAMLRMRGFERAARYTWAAAARATLDVYLALEGVDAVVRGL